MKSKYNVTDVAVRTYYPSGVTEDRYQLLEQMKPSVGEELWDGFVSGTKGAVKVGCYIIGGLLLIGLLAAL